MIARKVGTADNTVSYNSSDDYDSETENGTDSKSPVRLHRRDYDSEDDDQSDDGSDPEDPWKKKHKTHQVELDKTKSDQIIEEDSEEQNSKLISHKSIDDSGYVTGK